jgi:DNA-binding CsgD family transcriptional regulator
MRFPLPPGRHPHAAGTITLLPVTDRLSALIASRFAALPEEAQAALLLAAVADGPDLTGAASHSAGPDARALAPAEREGLVSRCGPRRPADGGARPHRARAQHSQRKGLPRLEQLVARARGILADPSIAEAQFDKALADPAGDQWPFERAQLRLEYAEWLRRRRRINDAKPVLAEALGTFRRLGARSCTKRAEGELRACGVAVPGATGERDALGELTPQQRQIVRLASEGLTNAQIGDRLFLSPRTVGSHLYRSYPKLGVADRHQLRDVIGRAGTSATAHESAEGEPEV